MELQFPAGRTFKIASIVDASNITFTAANPTAGWAGLRMEDAANTSFDNIVVERVKAGTSGYGAAITYIDSEPDISNSVIRNSIGPGVDGIYLGGDAQVGLVDEVRVVSVSGNGISLQGNFDYFRFLGNTLENNGGNGFSFTYNTAGFLGGNAIDGNLGQGIYAYSAQPFLAGTYAGPSGNNVLSSNDAGGILARAGSVLRGGTGGGYRFNSLLENGQPGSQWYDPAGNPKEGPDAWARDVGTVSYAQNNWWGRPANPDTTTCSVSSCAGFYTGTLFVDPMMSSAPGGGSLAKEGVTFLGSSVASAGDGFTGDGDAGPTLIRAALLDASDAIDSGRHSEALRLLEELVATPGESRFASVAVSEIGQLAIASRSRGGEDVSRAALATLEHAATSGAPHRDAALATLANVRLAGGDASGALAAADALLEDGSVEWSNLGHTARFFALLAGDRSGSAGFSRSAEALAVLERAAPEGDEAKQARQALIMIAGASGAEALARSAGALAAAKTGDGSQRFESDHLTLRPNPTTGVAFAGFTLADATDVTIEVLDARGRIVDVMHRGFLDLGYHEFALRRDLPTGVYVLRARTAATVRTERFTVVR